MAFFKELIVKITGDSSGLRKETQKAQGVISGFEGGLKTMGAGIAAAFTVKAVIQFGKESVKAFDEAAKSQAKLLSSLGGQVDVTKRLLSQSTLLQSNSLFDDETIQGAQMFLATMKLTESQITRILPLVMDFATKTGVDLVSAANLVSKTIGSSVNALGRYGIEVTGAAGSSERFEMVVEGLTRQVGGLSKAATDAGTSGLVQLRNAIDDIKESIGRVIGGPIQKFAKNLKEIIELRTGVTAANYATQIETEGRNMASSAKTTEDARKALVDYITVQKNRLQGLYDEKKAFEDSAKSHFLNATAMRADQTAAKQIGAEIEGVRVATKNLTDLLSNSKGIDELIGKGIGMVTDNLAAYQAQVKELTEHQALPTTTVEQAKADQLQINNLNTKIALITEYGKVLGTTAVIQARIDELNKQYDSTADVSKLQYIQAIIDKLQKQLDIEKQLRGTVYGRDIEVTKISPHLATTMTTKEETSALALRKEKGLPDRELPSADISSNLKDLQAYYGLIVDAKKGLPELTTMTDTLADSLKQMGNSLVDGAESWKDFGNMAFDALKRMVAGLIAEGVAAQVAKALVDLPLGIGLGVGAVVGGLAAGVFSTALNQIPSYAHGGEVNGPTLALIGDNPGRREMVIPSEQYGQFTKGGAKLEAYISGRQLKFVLDQYNSSQSRMGG